MDDDSIEVPSYFAMQLMDVIPPDFRINESFSRVDFSNRISAQLDNDTDASLNAVTNLVINSGNSDIIKCVFNEMKKRKVHHYFIDTISAKGDGFSNIICRLLSSDDIELARYLVIYVMLPFTKVDILEVIVNSHLVLNCTTETYRFLMSSCTPIRY